MINVKLPGNIVDVHLPAISAEEQVVYETEERILSDSDTRVTSDGSIREISDELTSQPEVVNIKLPGSTIFIEVPNG